MKQFSFWSFKDILNPFVGERITFCATQLSGIQNIVSDIGTRFLSLMRIES